MKPRIFQYNLLLLLLALIPTATLGAVLGIDFGSAFSKSVLLAPGVPFEPVLSSDSKRKDLTAFTFKPAHGPNTGSKTADIERIYGNAAQTLLARYPTQSLFYFKSLLGEDFEKSDSVKAYLDRFPGVDLVSSKNNRSSVSVNILNENYPIEELLAMYFSDIKTRSLSTLKSTDTNTALNVVTGSVTNTVITVPPSFSVFQRQAIEDAADLAELSLTALVNDGTAVITSYASNRQFSTTPEYHLILDIGAGESSASLFSIRSGGDSAPQSVIIELEGLGFDDSFGGHTITAIVKDLLVEKFIEAHGKAISKSSLQKDFKAQRKLWTEAEKVKTILSANTEVSAHIEGLFEDLDLRVKVSRVELESLVEPLLHRVTDPIYEALGNTLPGSKFHLEKQDKNGDDQLSSIIYMGGATRMPLIQKAVESVYGQDKISKKVNTDEAGAIGATLRAVGISKVFKSRNITVVEKTVNEYGVKFNVGSKKNFKQETLPLFTRGDILGSTNTIIVPFSLENSGLEILLSENGKEFANIEANEISKAIADKKCSSSPVVKAEFKLTLSQTVQLVDLWAECETIVESKPKVEPPKLVDQEDENSENIPSSEPEVDEGEKEAVPVTKLQKISIGRKYRSRTVRPLGTATKQSSSARLKFLEKSDKDRKSREALRNKIESEIYRVKELIMEKEDLIESGESDDVTKLINLDEIKQATEGLVEWLDYDASDATTKELTKKQDEIAALLKALEVKKSSPTEKQEQKADGKKKGDEPTGDLAELESLALKLQTLNTQSRSRKAEHDAKVEELLDSIAPNDKDPENPTGEEDIYSPPIDEIVSIFGQSGDELQLVVEMQTDLAGALEIIGVLPESDNDKSKKKSKNKKKDNKVSDLSLDKIVEKLRTTVEGIEQKQAQLDSIRQEKFKNVEEIIRNAEEQKKQAQKSENELKDEL